MSKEIKTIIIIIIIIIIKKVKQKQIRDFGPVACRETLGFDPR